MAAGGVMPFEESPDSLKQRCRVTPGRERRGNLPFPTESATENRLPYWKQKGKGETVG